MIEQQDSFTGIQGDSTGGGEGGRQSQQQPTKHHKIGTKWQNGNHYLREIDGKRHSLQLQNAELIWIFHWTCHMDFNIWHKLSTCGENTEWFWSSLKVSRPCSVNESTVLKKTYVANQGIWYRLLRLQLWCSYGDRTISFHVCATEMGDPPWRAWKWMYF